MRETGCLDAEERRAFDARLWEDPARVAGMGDRALVAEAKRLAYRLDPPARAPAEAPTRGGT